MCWIQRGTSAFTSDASASFAVAPFHVSTPIERIVRTAATIATGRADGLPLEPAVEERQHDQEDEAIVGTPTVPRKTDSGHLKIRSR